MTQKPNSFPKLTRHAKQYWKMARSRDETIEKNYGRKAAGKDTRAFWYLLGYWVGKTA